MASSHLMSEEDVLKYFLQNNGIVRNTEIVTYFRFYLSDPNIRDEARVLFKTFVNKLANVKTENGEKYLVLKRQYFPPIDGNGNGRPSLPQANYNQQQQQQHIPPPSTPQPFQNLNTSYISASGYPSSSSSSSRSGPGSSSYDPYPLPPHNPQGGIVSNNHPSLQRSLSQQSQSMSQAHLRGSAYSLTSNNPYSNDPYMNSNINSNYNNYPNYPNLPNIPISNNNNYLPNHPPPLHSHHPPIPGNNSNNNINYGVLPSPVLTNDYQMDYGLPPPPNIVSSSSPKRFPSPPSINNNSSNSMINSGNPGPRLLPPPYRPPPYRPPPPVGPTSTTMPSYMSGPIRNPNVRFSPPHQNFNSSEPTTPSSGPPYLIQRSLSVSGSLTSPLQYENSGKYFDNTHTNLHSSSSNPSLVPTQVPPAIPPRSKRQFERSMSTKSMDDPNRGGIMTERRNSMGATRGSVVNSNDDDDVSSQSSQIHNSNVGGSVVEKESDNNEKENVNTMGSVNYNSTDPIDGGDTCNFNGNSFEVEQKISVKERLQKFNRIASESELTASGANKMPSAPRNRREVASKHDSVDYDSASLSSFGYGFSSMQPRDKEWILKAAECDYHFLNKMAQENPGIVKRKDINYTALHWASKHGNTELIKLLAGTYKSNVNAKSNGGYTPLHLAAQFSRQDVYDILSRVYNADVNIRDHSGKKPMQYLVRQDSTLSSDTFKKLKDKRRSTEQREQRERDSNSFLRIGSLNVRVKKTTEAFNNYFGKSTSATSIERILHKTYGSADNIENGDTVDRDKQIMPPPSNPIKSSTGKRKNRRSGAQFNENSTTTTIKESQTDSDSDCGFGSDWKSPG